MTGSSVEQQTTSVVNPLALEAGEVAECNVLKAQSRSNLKRRSITKYNFNDFHIERTLGEGGFGQVFQVRLTSKAKRKSDEQTEGKNEKYALKCLNKKTLALPFNKRNRKTYINAATDLALEAYVLCRLNHKNIITVRGVSGGDDYGIAQSFAENEYGYFLVMDILNETLKDRLNVWQAMRAGEKHVLLEDVSSSALLMQGCQGKASLMARIESVALGVVSAMEYLHSNNVVLRDLKPDNIGFDKQGNVKLFDFGLAREIQSLDKNDIAGSLRYLAPECVKSKSCGFPADVYSFGVLLWELCTLEKAYGQFSNAKKFKERVFYQDFRPSMWSIPSRSLKSLIAVCWDPNPMTRPSFTTIKQILEDKIAASKTSSGGLSFSSIKSKMIGDKRLRQVLSSAA